MDPITNFRAHWNPGTNVFGIEIRTQSGRGGPLAINTPEEFIAILSILNGPSPAVAPTGEVVCQR